MSQNAAHYGAQVSGSSEGQQAQRQADPACVFPADLHVVVVPVRHAKQLVHLVRHTGGTESQDCTCSVHDA